MTKPKPCPICGSKNVHYANYKIVEITNKGHCLSAYFYCADCGCQSGKAHTEYHPYDNVKDWFDKAAKAKLKHDASRKWNMRVHPY